MLSKKDQLHFDELMRKWQEECKASPAYRLQQERNSWWSFGGGTRKFAEDHIGDREWLRQPRFNSSHVQQVLPRLTYRQINHWESMGLISPARETEESGWRRFSLVDLACLAIITELRSYGRDLPSIKKDIDWLRMSAQEEEDYFTGMPNPDDRDKMRGFFRAMHWFTLTGEQKAALFQLSKLGTNGGHSISTVKDRLNEIELNLLLCPAFHVGAVAQAFGPVSIAPADVWVVHIAEMMQRTQSFLYIPISEYVRKALNLAQNTNFPAVDSGLAGILSSEYRNILWLIQDPSTESVTVTKKADGKVDVRRLTRMSGRFDDQDILKALNAGDHLKLEVIKQHGEVLKITIEYRLRIGH